jgi:hypothetical protein
VVTNKALAEDTFYTVSGYVLDDESGNWIRNASIYEKNGLPPQLTNSQGYFQAAAETKKQRSHADGEQGILQRHRRLPLIRATTSSLPSPCSGNRRPCNHHQS